MRQQQKLITVTVNIFLFIPFGSVWPVPAALSSRNRRKRFAVRVLVWPVPAALSNRDRRIRFAVWTLVCPVLAALSSPYSQHCAILSASPNHLYASVCDYDLLKSAILSASPNRLYAPMCDYDLLKSAILSVCVFCCAARSVSLSFEQNCTFAGTWVSLF